MRMFLRPRLRWPAITVLTGAAFAVAWVVRGGAGWWLSIVIGIVTVARAVAVYLQGGKDSDEGALAGSRADERQRMVGLKSRALAGGTAVLASYLGLTVSVAARSAAWWPFLIMLLVSGFAYLYGLSTYGTGEPDLAEEASGLRGAADLD